MGTQGDGDGAAGGPDAKKDDIYENRPGSKKIIRVVTVMAYMVSVSFVAIVLSAYYVFLWQPPNPRLMHRSHLRGDPQVDYLVHRPPTEVSLDEKLSGIDIRDKVNVFREEIIRNRGVNVSFESREEFLPEKTTNNNVSRGNSINSENEIIRKNSRIIASTWNPIIRALLATTEIPTTEETPDNSTGVYESSDVSTKISSDTEILEVSTLFTTTREISGSTISSSSSPSTPLTEDRDTLYNESMNKFTSIATPPTERDINRSESNRISKNSTEKTALQRGIDDSMPTRAQELRKNSTNTRVAISAKETTVEIAETFDTSTTVRIKPETVQNIARFADQREKSDWKAPEITVQPIQLVSNITTASTISPTNETEISEKFSPTLQANGEIPIEIDGSTGDARIFSKPGVSMVPAVVQPESEYVDNKQQQSKEQSTRDNDFGLI